MDIPIWYVVLTYNPHTAMFPVWQVLKSIPCTLGDLDRLYEQEAAPLYAEGRQPLQTMVFARDVPNPVNTANDNPT